MKYYLSIDIGGTNIKHGLMNHSGKLILNGTKKTPKNKEDFFDALNKIILANLHKIRGIAISVPGKVIPETGTVYYGGSLPFLDQVNFNEYVTSRFHLPVAVENDGKAAALAELWLGSLKGIDNGAVIVLGTGVGGGVILDGRLYRGFHNQAGELSFMNLGSKITTQDNIAGYQGSAVKMIQECAKKLHLKEINNGVRVFQALNEKDKRISDIFNDYCQTIAVIILNIQSVIDVQRFSISGGISAQPLVLNGIKRAYSKISEHAPIVAQQMQSPEIVEAYFKNNANLYGALYSLLLKMESKNLEKINV